MCKQQKIKILKDFISILYKTENIFKNNGINPFSLNIKIDFQLNKSQKLNLSLYHEYTYFIRKIKECRKCDLNLNRNNIVIGDGNLNTRVMIIGEAPGETEDKTGKPFTGRAGKLLDLMLSRIGITRSEIYITNVVKCRPPGNRTPLENEISLCSEYLIEQIKIIKPDIIVGLGRVAAQYISKSSKNLYELRKKIIVIDRFKIGKPVYLISTYHPSAVLRNSQLEKIFYNDLKKIRILMKKLNINSFLK